MLNGHEKIRIALIVPSYLPIPSVRGGAIETLVDNLIYENEKHKKLNIVVYSVYDSEAEAEAKKLKHTNVIYIHGDGLRGRVFSHVRNIKNKLRRGNSAFDSYFLMKACEDIKKRDIDFVIVEGDRNAAEAVKKRISQPLIVHLHNTFHAASERAEEIAKAVDYFFTVSDYIKREALTVPGVAEDTVFTVHNCTDTERFHRARYTVDRARIRKEFQISESDVLLIFTGRLVPEKGVYELAQAVSEASGDVKLMILGASSFDQPSKTDYVAKLEAVIEKNPGKVFFTGFVKHSEIAKYYAAADIAVVPSLWEEPAALTVIESLSMALPLIATKSGGMVEYFDEGCAIALEKDAETIVRELKAAIDRLSHDQELRCKMGEHAREHILKFDIGNYYAEYCETLESVFRKETKSGKNRDCYISQGR